MKVHELLLALGGHEALGREAASVFSGDLEGGGEGEGFLFWMFLALLYVVFLGGGGGGGRGRVGLGFRVSGLWLGFRVEKLRV